MATTGNGHILRLNADFDNLSTLSPFYKTEPDESNLSPIPDPVLRLKEDQPFLHKANSCILEVTQGFDKLPIL